MGPANFHMANHAPQAIHPGTSGQYVPVAAAASRNSSQGATHFSGYPNGQLMSPTQGQSGLSNAQLPQYASAQKISQNAGSKAFQYLQKKGNLHANGQVLVNSSEMNGGSSNSHLIKRIGSGRQVSQSQENINVK